MAAPMNFSRLAQNLIRNVRNTSIRNHMPHDRPKIYGGWEPMFREDRKRIREEVAEVTKSFSEISKEEQDKLEINERLPVNIGLDYKPRRSAARKIIHQNAELLEQAARHRTLKIPLEELHDGWNVEYEPIHTKKLAKHYGIYRDLFDNAFFYPVVNLRISYSHDEEFVTPVYRGNVVMPSDAMVAPSVEYEADDDTLWTLLLTNPDSHLSDNNSEYMHWMIGNIPGSDVSKGEVLCDYLQPFPPSGTGFHRHVFILFKQSEKIDYSSVKRSSNCTNLKERTFKTADFYEDHEDHLTPVGLRFFQAEHDSSVKNVYHNILEMREPAFQYQHEPYYHPPLSMYPGKQPFDRYYDRYRDTKDLNEEVMKMKFAMSDPTKPYKPKLKYPLAHRGPPRASWIRNRETLLHRRQEQFEDLPE